MSRIDLGEGRWAEVHDVIKHRHAVAMEGAYFEARHAVDDGVFPASFRNNVVLAMTEKWSLGDLSTEVIDDTDEAVIEQLFEACEAAYIKAKAKAEIPQASRPQSD